MLLDLSMHCAGNAAWSTIGEYFISFDLLRGATNVLSGLESTASCFFYSVRARACVRRCGTALLQFEV